MKQSRSLIALALVVATGCYASHPNVDRDEPMYARRPDGAPVDRAAWDELPWRSFGEWLEARVSAAVRLSRDDLEI